MGCTSSDPTEEDPDAVTDPACPTPTAPPAGRTPRPTACRRGETPAPRPTGAPPLDVARRIVELAEDKKAADIVLLDLAGLTTLADCFVICSGGSERQLDAIADGIIEGLRDERRPPDRSRGDGRVALGPARLRRRSIVHVFTPPERDYYQLEKHWSEAKTVLRVQ